ncbi:hypothetical protein K7H22_07385 [Seohaeicola saemankumensis]|uniref:hypothetical protein n=1 Tax=Seohaeicola saemankumensis TaxID=481181 RepID=UPI001E413057|nr:hypothetical protein [Seohaeicola saemankumensis]MCD1625806.1 hypothetical protein [Seohaeicola saemankumensis]
MANWITATGEIEGSASTLTSPDSPAPLGGSGPSDGGFRGRDTSAGFTARANDDESEGVMATVRSQAGSPIMTRNPNGNDLIKYQGATITLDVAAHLGLVNRNPDGSFSDKATTAALKDPTSGAKAPADKANEKRAEAEDDTVTFGEKAQATLQELLATQKHHPGNMFRAVDSVLHTGDLDATAIERMASIEGVEPAEMRAKVETVWQGAYDTGTDILAEAGIEDEDAFQAFITSDLRRKSEFTEAARNLFVHGKPEGLRAMAEAYLPAMDRYEGARVKAMLTEAGWQFSEKAGGGINVIVHGTQVPWEVAVKQKIITFSRG